jgi:hypothetical protein
VFERIFRAPQKFELQRFHIAGPRAEVFQKYAAMLTRESVTEPDLLGVVRPLVRMVKELPDFVAKTRLIGETAQNVLRAIREAREPDRLIFADLPAACGFPAIESRGKIDPVQLDTYFSLLRSAFVELQQTYPRLLVEIEALILKAFQHKGSLGEARAKMTHHGSLVLNLAVDAKIKSFLVRVTDTTLDDRTWLESLASLFGGKPPAAWDDQDRARFEVNLVGTARTFHHYEVLAFEMARTGMALLDGDQRTLRVSITAPGSEELEQIIRIPVGMDGRIARTLAGVKRVLEEEGILADHQLSVAILARMTQQLLGGPTSVPSHNETHAQD